MAKRFIDTGMFDDDWFMSLSPNSKLLWIYFITKCDHAGILKANVKLIEFQTGLKSIHKLLQEMSDKIVIVRDGIYFCPAYLKFQYPNFPKSKVQQQEGALKILISYGLWDNKLNSLASVCKELPNSYDSVIDSVIDNTEIEIKKNALQIYISENFKSVSKMKEQLTFEESERLLHEYPKDEIKRILSIMENRLDLLKNNKSVNLTIRNWLGRDKILPSKKSLYDYNTGKINQVEQPPETKEEATANVDLYFNREKK